MYKHVTKSMLQKAGRVGSAGTESSQVLLQVLYSTGERILSLSLFYPGRKQIVVKSSGIRKHLYVQLYVNLYIACYVQFTIYTYKLDHRSCIFNYNYNKHISLNLVILYILFILN